MYDSYGREIQYLRISVTERCNLRCRYCMPEKDACAADCADMLTEAEILQAVRVAASLGIWKLRITGGEPLVRKDILSICRRIAQAEGVREVCMTTNGLLLPEMAVPLRQAGVHRVNLSLDTLDPERYAYITRGGCLPHALQGLHAALDAGFDRVKINVVLIGGFNDREIGDLAGLSLRLPVDVRFIELMPMPGNVALSAKAYLPCSVVLQRLPELEPLERRDGVAQLYRLPGGIGTVGLISPVSNHFCGSCNRLRLTADGKLRACLYADEEFSLKHLDEKGMTAQFRAAVAAKPPCHPDLAPGFSAGDGRAMNRIGG